MLTFKNVRKEIHAESLKIFTHYKNMIIYSTVPDVEVVNF